MMKKLTKRQRKALRGPNYAMQQSLKHGLEYMIGGTLYKGIPGKGGLPLVRA